METTTTTTNKQEIDPWELKVTIKEITSPRTISTFTLSTPHMKFWHCTIERHGESMQTQFMSEHKPSEEDALVIIGAECMVADIYNTPALFKTAFSTLFEEDDFTTRTYNEMYIDMQNLAQTFKTVLGSELYALYTLNTETTVSN